MAFLSSFSTDLASVEALKDLRASSISTSPLTECTSQQQQPLGSLQIGLPTDGATSREPSTAENMSIFLSAFEIPPNGRLTTSSPSGGYQLAESLTETSSLTEDPPTIPADEVNRFQLSSSPSYIRSVAGGTERIIKDSTEEITNSNEGGERSKNEDIMNGHHECPICEKFVKPVSLIWTCKICKRVLHLSCAAMEDWRCPCSLQNILDQLSKDKSRSKRTFGEMVECDLVTDDDDTDSETIVDDEPPLKKHKKSTLTIDILIKATEEEERTQRRQAFRFVRKGGGMEMDDNFWEYWDQLRRQRVCLADIQSVILGRQIGTSKSSLSHPSRVLRILMNDNEAEKQKIEKEFNDGVRHKDSIVLLDRYSLLEGRRESLMETKNWIDAEYLFGEEVEE
ncbi:hypothetical protein F5882DRAFT_376769 [Hyaloscypha sp. PMI_1271]|nr:hypothetical protein F5882DRAFT_376769 [Hyaloscypha sp. PMI_1271]